MPHNGQGRWGRLRPVQQDPLDVYGLPSKGEMRLHDFKTQERYYTKIIERYLAFCTAADGRDGLLEQFASLEIAGREELAKSSEQPGGGAGSAGGASVTSAATAAARRARAAILPAATTAPTSTASTASMTSMASTASTSSTASASSVTSSLVTTAAAAAAAAAKTAHAAKDLSDVLMALRKLREAVVATKRADDFSVQVYLFCIRLAVLARQPEAYHPAILYLLRVMGRQHPLTRVEAHEVTAYLVLDAACRRGDLAEAYRLRCRHRFRDRIVDNVLAALARDDWLAFRRLLRRVDGHQAKLLECAEHAMRVHTLKCFGRAYLRLDDVAYLESVTGVDWADLQDKYGVGWERDGKAVIIRKVKPKTPAAQVA